VVGTVLGVAAFVSTLGLGATLSRQVSSSFDIRRATEVILRPDKPGLDVRWLDDGAISRLARLNGVVREGRRISVGEKPVRRTPDLTQPGIGVPLIGADAGALRVMAPVLTLGRLFDKFHDRDAVPVVMLSASVAREVGVNRVGVAVFVDGRAYTVIGVYRDVARRPEALAAAIVPYSVADQLVSPLSAGDEPQRDILIETKPGAAQIIGRQAPLAVRPEAAADLQAIAPPDPRTLRREIEASVTRSTILLSVVALLIGTISIGNSATAAIATRTSEIGLRRAVGARASHIFLQLVAETAALGGLGGVVGALLGILTTSVVALLNGWIPVIEIRSALTACAASAAAGVIAGLLPAIRATRIPPVRALQR
jgi:putative ABC transport system permease protein